MAHTREMSQKRFEARNVKLQRWANNNEQFKTLDIRRQRRYIAIVAENMSHVGLSDHRRQTRRAGRLSA